MKPVATVFLTLISASGCATEFRIFDQEMRLREDCSLEVRSPDDTTATHRLPLVNRDRCVVLPVSGTNVPRMELVQGDYVFLVEAQRRDGDECTGELAAVVVHRDGQVVVGQKTRKTGTCGYGERKDFEILRYHATKQPPLR